METANMPHRFSRCSVLATASLALLAVTAFAQTTPLTPADLRQSLNGPVKDRPQPAASQGQIPHTEDGKPDLSGNWAPDSVGENVDLRASLREIGRVIPFQPWAEDLYLERKADLSTHDQEGHCLPPRLLRVTTALYQFRIVETPNLILILFEGGSHVWRQIFTDGRQHPVDNLTPHGHSIGQWEGDTLVVDSVGFNGEAWLDESGVPTTRSLHLIERFRRPDLGHLEIESIVDDPKAYTKQWSFTTHPVMLKGDFMEDICQEKYVEHLVGKK